MEPRIRIYRLPHRGRGDVTKFENVQDALGAYWEDDNGDLRDRFPDLFEPATINDKDELSRPVCLISDFDLLATAVADDQRNSLIIEVSDCTELLANSPKGTFGCEGARGDWPCPGKAQFQCQMCRRIICWRCNANHAGEYEAVDISRLEAEQARQRKDPPMDPFHELEHAEPGFRGRS